MSFVKTDLADDIFKITLARPEVRNAFHPDMIQELTEAFKAADASSARLVFLSGEGKSFCAGADLEWMKSMKNFSLEENQTDSEKLFEMFEAGRNCSLPLLGRMQGHVMGGATGLVAICDFATAEENTKFCFSEVKLGLAPAVISPFVLRKMNMVMGRELMISGRVFAAPEAAEAGLLNHQGTEAGVQKYIETVMENIFAAGPEATRATKELINKVSQPLFNGLKQETAKVIAERRVSDEGQAGLNAFFQKSPAPWKKEPDAKL